jgi:hypothetical protein
MPCSPTQAMRSSCLRSLTWMANLYHSQVDAEIRYHEQHTGSISSYVGKADAGFGNRSRVHMTSSDGSREKVGRGTVTAMTADKLVIGQWHGSDGAMWVLTPCLANMSLRLERNGQVGASPAYAPCMGVHACLPACMLTSPCQACVLLTSPPLHAMPCSRSLCPTQTAPRPMAQLSARASEQWACTHLMMARAAWTVATTFI